jgi:hypothetical protein
MSIIQGVIASMGGASAPPPPPPYYGSIFTLEPAVSAFNGQIGWWSWGGSITAASAVSSNPPTRDAYTYPDGEAEYVYTFNGTDNWMISPQLTTTGAWPDTSITIDMWFYPTSNGITLLAELDQNSAPNTNYNYNMMEIDSSGYLLAGVYPSGHVTSPNPVTLNAWNHVYFFHDVQNSLRLELNGNLDGTHAVNGTASSGYSPPGARFFGIGGGGDGTNMGDTAYFQGKIGTVYIYDTIAQSSYNATKDKHIAVVQTFQSGIPPASGTDWSGATINGSYSLVPSGAPGAGSGITLPSGSYISVPAKLNLTSWTVEVVAELNPTGYWATVWGNDSWNAGQGYIAYLGNSSDLEVGAAGGGTSGSSLPGINIADKAHWVFVNDAGTLHLYRNGTELTVNGGFSAPSSVPNNILIGARHMNDGTGNTDYCPGNYYYINIRSTALDSSGVTAAYSALSGTYSI